MEAKAEAIKDISKRFSDLLSKISRLEETSYQIEVFIDGRTYFEIDLETGKVFYTKSVILSCECCTEYQTDFTYLSDLNESDQFEILIALARRK